MYYFRFSEAAKKTKKYKIPTRNLELKQAKAQSRAMRNKTVQYRDKINYQNELDRIRGELSRNATRLPVGTIRRLNEREKELKS